MKLSASAQELIARFPLGFVATVTPGGSPSVSPKGTFLVLDDETVAFGEIRSPQTVTNLTHRPELEVNFVDPFTRKGVRLRTGAVFVRRGTEEFATLLPRWETVWGDLAQRINIIVKLPVESVSLLTTPLYDDGATEDEMIALFKRKYAEIYP
ncbi:pyridoxamine 5'-phosphate oxidase family protein [Maritimibacter sp. 55A14]|uniref:pyridoxamine 5'-phosphate oxidase family protein n=1 Tax=Maritimibacter sp. 55A14 TaxID=2174844 RepID=UPI000D611371|nr:pyridoxamine 5'-phosphate oxidase family protein [Maritimibacter sp. 55A14]PWE29327.1 pyridoxamine 5'-phosphate oxidase family protein [Maritimibacter sp. 55A14]